MVFLSQWAQPSDIQLFQWIAVTVGCAGLFGTLFSSAHRSTWGILLAVALGTGIALWRLSLESVPMVPETVLAPLQALRASIEAHMRTLFPEPHASLLSGLLLGGGKGMPRELLEAFKASGLTHIIAVSGYNITMLVTIVSASLFWLPLRMRLVPSIVMVVGFTLLTGASASAVRAAVMGILGLIALHAGRTTTARLSVLWTAFFMLCWNPAYLWDDAGFQLSFLALIGLQEISPLLQPTFEKLPPLCGMRDALCLTLSTQLTTTPWILYMFGRLSIAAPLTNLLAPPAVPFAMLLGCLALLTGWISPWIGRLMAMIAWLPLQWIISVAQTTAAIPYSNLQALSFGAPMVVLSYAILLYWVTTRNDTASGAPSPTAPAPFPPTLCSETGMNAK